jgi:hypothetical protein
MAIKEVSNSQRSQPAPRVEERKREEPREEAPKKVAAKVDDENRKKIAEA